MRTQSYDIDIFFQKVAITAVMAIILCAYSNYNFANNSDQCQSDAEMDCSNASDLVTNQQSKKEFYEICMQNKLLQMCNIETTQVIGHAPNPGIDDWYQSDLDHLDYDYFDYDNTPYANNSNSAGDQSHPSKETCHPVDIRSGKKMLHERDIVSIHGNPIAVEREYSPSNSGIFGTGWLSNLDQKLIFHFHNGGSCSIKFGSPLPAACSKTTSNPESIKVIELFTMAGKIPLVRDGNDRKWNSIGKRHLSLNLTDGNTWRLHLPDGTIESYDQYGRRFNIVNIHGIANGFLYGGVNNNQLIYITNTPDEIRLQWSPSADKVSNIIDKNGKNTEYLYQLSNGRLSTIIFPESTGRKIYKYDSYNRLVGFTLNSDVHLTPVYETEYTYSSSTPLVLKSGLKNDIEVTHFSRSTNKTQLTNAASGKTTYHYQDSLNPTKIDFSETPACPFYSHSFNYDSKGNMEWKIDGRGIYTEYLYDSDNRLILEYSAGKTTKKTWDKYNRILTTSIWEGATNEVKCLGTSYCPRASYPPYKIESFTYGGSEVKNRLIEHRITDSQGKDSITTYSYSFPHPKAGSNFPYEIIIDGPRDDVSDITKISYDPYRRVSSINKGHGYETIYHYQNLSAHPKKIIYPNNISYEFVYDGKYRITSKTKTTNNNISLETKYYYDAADNLSKTISPNGEITEYQYDLAGRLIATKMPVKLSPPRVEKYLTYSYDKLSNPIQVGLKTISVNQGCSGNNCPPETHIYDSFASYTYDNQGNKTSETLNGIKKTYTYIADRLLESVRDGFGNETKMSYYDSGLLKTVRQPDGALTTFNYDPLSKLTEVVAPNSLSTHYQNNALNGIEKIVSPDTKTINNTFYSNGLIKTSTNADGSTVSYEYDALNRPTLIEARSSQGYPKLIRYNYGGSTATCDNGIGKLCEVVDDSGKTAYTYTPFGAIASKNVTINNQTYTIQYNYDNYERLSSMVYPGNHYEVKYTYGVRNRVIKLQVRLGNQWKTVLDDHSNDDNQSTIYTFGNGLKRTVIREKNLVKKIETPNVQSLLLTRNNTGNIIDIHNVINPKATQKLTYDSISRLTSITSTASIQSFTYDLNGNRMSAKSTATVGGTQNYTYQSGTNQLIQFTHPDSQVPHTSYIYNLSGNVTAYRWYHSGGFIQAGGNLNYDALNRVESTNTALAGSTFYHINAFNQRVHKTPINNAGSRIGASSAYSYLYDENGLLIAETMENASTLGSLYIYHQGEIVGLVRNNTLYAVHNDHLGRPEVITDQNKNIVWRATNLPFDRKIEMTKIGAFNIGFPGQYYDSESTLWYNWHRYYDASIGRYLQSDPIGLAGGINTYAYAGNNPVKFVDPYGLFTISLASGANVTVGKGYGAQSGVYLTTGGNTSSAAAGGFVTQSKTTGFGAGFGIGVDFFKGGPETFNGESKTETVCIGPVCFSSHTNSDEWIGLGASIGGDSGGGSYPGGSFTHAENCTTSNPLIGGK